MTSVSIHLTSAHLPLGGGLVLLGLLVFATWHGGRTLWQACFGAAVLVALMAVVSMTSGPSALVATEPWLDADGRDLAADHETLGRISTYLWVAAATLAVVGFARMESSGPRGQWFRFGLLGVVLAALLVSVLAGASGGRIRHEELRAGASSSEVVDEQP